MANHEDQPSLWQDLKAMPPSAHRYARITAEVGMTLFVVVVVLRGFDVLAVIVLGLAFAAGLAAAFTKPEPDDD